MNTHDIELPPLHDLPAYSPEVFDREVKVVSETMVEQLMHDYARTAIEADRKRRIGRMSDCLINIRVGLYPLPDNPLQGEAIRGEDRLNAIGDCFKQINRYFPDLSYGIPLIGAGLAGGLWKDISSVINENSPDMKIILVRYNG